MFQDLMNAPRILSIANLPSVRLYVKQMTYIFQRSYGKLKHNKQI